MTISGVRGVLPALYPVYRFPEFMIAVKTIAEIPIEKSHNTTGNGDAQTCNIDKNKGLVSGETSKRDRNVISEHKDCVLS